MTTGTPEKENDAIWDEATDWILRIDAAPDDAALHARRDAWLLENEEHAKAYRKAERAWHLAGDVPPAHADHWAAKAAAEAAPSRIVDMPRQRAAGRRHLGWSLAGCALAACLFVVPALQLQLRADYATGVGQSRQVTLADGTIVHLDTASAIGARFTTSGREASLLSGRAFFQVVPDTERRFSVDAGNATVIVTGTAFSVGLTTESIAVAVQRGSVKVNDKQGRTIEARLLPGERLRIDRTTAAMTRDKIAVSQVAAWRHGQLVVEDATIAEVVGELRHYHRGLIIVRDAALASRHVTGVYDLRNPAAALRAAVQPYAGTVHELTSYLLVVSGG
jgi:transmembrane sensor